MAPNLQPAIWLLFAAAAYASLRVPRLGVDPTAVRIVADPILARRRPRRPPGTRGRSWSPSRPPRGRPTRCSPSVRWLRLAEGALGLAALARSLCLPFPALGRRTLALFIVGVAAFAFAPVNIWIHGSRRALLAP